jgi:dihydroxyacid dehydratase/phosphogluconate dehydratase
MTHRGRAVVFEGIDDYHARIDDDSLDIDASCVMVLKGCGPKGYPGMAEVGNMGLPAKLLRQGVKDMVRISDARMSGTAFGTIVLHIAPEAMELGPLAAVENGDEIVLEAANGLLQLEVSDDEIARRLEARRDRYVLPRTGGYLELYRQHVLQADEGCDFDFLVGCRGADVPAHSH